MASTDVEDGTANMAKNLALGFLNFSVMTENPTSALVYNVSGFVEKGRITAVMGASAAGKSLLLQALSGRIQDLMLSGDVMMDGQVVDPKNVTNPVSYVPQFDTLNGELTARETTTNTALFKRNQPLSVIQGEVNSLLDRVGLSHVADGIIGTIIFRGLSGGQKKRAEIAAELIASPSILILDEPTSGLDSSIAYEVVKGIKELAQNSKGMLSVILSIHQPNSRILELFDHLLLLERGSNIFFGTVPEALSYFSRIGFPCPDAVTATDYFLQISDSNFSFAKDLDFHESFEKSPENAILMKTLKTLKRLCEDPKKILVREQSARTFMIMHVPFWKQLYTLIYRDYTLAYRDPTLYYFQVILILSFAFLTGAVFWDLPREVDGSYNLSLSGMLWITLMHCWIHAFKVFYISSCDKRAVHEISNNAYSPWASFLADSISTATLTVLFFPVPAIAYFMMGFPAKGYPFVILNSWMTSLAGESMVSLITKFSHDPTVSMIFVQVALVNLQVFGGGVFLAWNDCPDWWIWLQEMCVFTQGSRAMIMEVMNHMEFDCRLSGGVCIDPGTGDKYDCDSFSADGKWCKVRGREMLSVTQGIGRDDSHWYYFAYLCAIFVGYKVCILILTYWPWDRIHYYLTHRASGSYQTDLADLKEASRISESSKKSLKDSGKKSKRDDYSAVATTSAESVNTDHKIKDKFNVVSPELKRQVSAGRELSFHGKAEASLTWTDLSVILPKSGAKLVDNVSGFVRSGRVLALMGPSGAGKTTLLNGLAGRASYAEISGQVRFAGREVTNTDLTYVPQFDEVNGIMTVSEHMLFVGALTCTDRDEMLKRASDLMEVLGLTDKKDVAVNDLSGGEVKRVSVGIGMISNPHILFLDEPTTGLDSTAAFSIVSYLVTVAKATNVAVIMTIHQPSALVFGMLDDLLLLESGKVVYGGTIDQANDYFSSIGFTNPHKVNPADYFLELVMNPPSEGSWSDKFSASEYSEGFLRACKDARDAKADKPVAKQPGFISRAWIMLRYFMVYFYKEPGFFLYRVYALIVTAVFAGTLYLNLVTDTDVINSYIGAMVFTAIAVMLTAVASTAIFARNRREAVDRIANGYYTPGLYVMNQAIASAVYNWGASFIFVCIFHWLTKINPNHESFIYDIFISWGHLMLMESVLQVLIEVLKNEFLSTTAGMIFIGSNMLFCGFFRPVPNIPESISWMCYIVPMKWSFDGFAWKVFHSQTFKVSGTSPAVFVDGSYILDNIFRLRDVPSWGFFGALLGYVFFFRFNQWFMLSVQTGTIQLPFKMPSFGPMGKGSQEHQPVSTKEVQLQSVAPLSEIAMVTTAERVI